jgi:hypothetical protein
MAVVLIRRVVALAATLAFAWVSWMLATTPSIGAAGLLAVLLAGLAGAGQANAVLVLAASAPLGGALAIAAGASASWTNVAFFSALAGWAAREVIGWSAAPDPRFRQWCCALAALAAASGSALWAGRVWAHIPDRAELVEAVGLLGREVARPATAIHESLTLAGGALAALMVAETCRRHPAVVPRAIRMLVLAVAALALLSVYRLGELAVRSGLSPAEAVALAGTLRVSPVVPDLNAAGALFLLAIPVAAEWCLERRGRLLGAACLAVLAAGAWLAGSRIALAMILPSLLLIPILRSSRGPRSIVAAALGGAVVMAVLLVPSTRHIGASTAWSVRRDMAVVTGQMLRHQPVFGVGIGRFADHSTAYMPPTLRALYVRENAHNQFFQILGELGLPGLVGLGGFVWLVLLPALRGTSGAGGVGLTAGLIAFVFTWMGQHPLLEVHVAAAFWIAAGLERGRSPAPTAPARTARYLPLALLVAAVVTWPLQSLVRAREMDLAGRVVGASAEIDDPDGGPRFRSTRRRATVYLPRHRTGCTLALRARGIPDEALVFVEFDHAPVGRFAVARGEWRNVEFVLPRRPEWTLRHHRLDVSWTPPPTRGRSALDIARLDCR